jgi:hypothetical protein
MWPVIEPTDWCGAWSPFWNPADYSAAVVNFANTSAGDLLCITGSATQVVRVQRVSISGAAANAATIDIALFLRSALDTGGTPTVIAPVVSDLLDPPATAKVSAFSVAPTAGTPIGPIRAQKYQISPANQGGTTIPLVWVAEPGTQELAVLRGATNTLCVWTSGLNGGTWDLSVQWLESGA